MNNDIRAYAIISENGEILQMLQTNEKGYRKSIENNQIWAVTPDTGRLLPEEAGGQITGFSEKNGWYEAVVKIESSGSVDSKSTAIHKPSSDSTTDASSAIFERLFKVIKQRKKDLPEGSYTTHLFKSGMSKIKKKAGEEAIELLLAENKEEIIYESADLIYHMLVLLVASDIELDEIFCELQSRE